MRTAIIVLILVALAAAATMNIYLVLDGSDATILSNAQEAYIFIGIRHIGHEVNCLRVPWFLAKNYLGGIEEPDSDRGSLVVMRATTAGVERHDLKIEYRPPGNAPGQYTPRRGRIYANYPGLGGLCWWAGDHFEAATPDERRGFNGIDGLTKNDFDPGWSSHEFTVEPGDPNKEFIVDVGDEFGLTVSNQNRGRSLSIQLKRPGKAPETVWISDLLWGSVSKAQYRHLLKDRQ